MRRFEFVGGSSSKFWEIGADGGVVQTRWGRIGTNGQSKEKDAGTAEAAQKEVAKQIRGKLKKGYVEAGDAPEPAAPAASPVVAVVAVVAPPVPEPAVVAPPVEAAAPKPQPVAPTRDAVPATQPAAVTLRPTLSLEDLARVHPFRSGAPVEPPPFDAAAWSVFSGKNTEGVWSWDLPNRGAFGALRRRAKHLLASDEPPTETDEELLWSALILADHRVAARTSIHLQSGVPPFHPFFLWAGATFDVADVLPFFLRGVAHRHRLLEGKTQYLAAWQHRWWPGIRRWLATLDARDWERARAAAEVFWDESPRPGQKRALVYCFPDVPEWAARLGRGIEANGDPRGLGEVLLSTDDPAYAESLVRQFPRAIGNDALLLVPTLIARMGGEALGPVLALADNLPAGAALYNETMVAQVGTLPQDAATDWIVARSGKRGYKKYAQAWIAAHPERSVPRLLALSRLDPGQAGALQKLQDEHPDLFEPVDDSDRLSAATAGVPECLTSPPWSGKKRRSKPVVLEVTLPPEPSRLDWFPGAEDREQHLAPSEYEAWAIESIRDLERPRHGANVSDFAHLPMNELRRLWPRPIAGWDRHGELMYEESKEELRRLVARLGDWGAEGFVELAEADPPTYVSGLLYLRGPRVGHALAVCSKWKATWPDTEAWADRHPRDAVLGFASAALGPDKKLREFARRLIARAAFVGPDAFEDALTTLGGAVAEALSPLRGGGDLSMHPARVPAAPHWAPPGRLPQVELKTGGVLPDEACGVLLQMMAISPLLPPYAGLRLIEGACTPESLDAFAWAVFERWMGEGGKAKGNWAMSGLAWFGSDETISKLGGLAKMWPKQGGAARANRALEVLDAHGSRAGVAQLALLAARAPTKGLKAKAAQRTYAVAARIGVSRDDLDEQLLTDARSVKKRLEAAMVSGRTWPLALARSRYFEPAEVNKVAHKLLWSVDGVPVSVGKDGAVLGIEGDPADGERVAVAHPASLSAEEVAGWKKRLKALKVGKQPFEQLARAVDRTTDPDEQRDWLEDLKGATAPASLVRQLEGRGWDRSYVESGVAAEHRRPVSGGGHIEISWSPAYYIPDPSVNPEVGVASIEVRLPGDDLGLIEPLDPIDWSEIRRELGRLTQGDNA